MVKLNRFLSASRLKLHLVPGSWKLLKDLQSKNSKHAHKTIKKQQAQHLKTVTHRRREVCWNYSYSVKGLNFKAAVCWTKQRTRHYLDRDKVLETHTCNSERSASLRSHACTQYLSPQQCSVIITTIFALLFLFGSTELGRRWGGWEGGTLLPKASHRKLEHSQEKWKICNFSGKEGIWTRGLPFLAKCSQRVAWKGQWHLDSPQNQMTLHFTGGPRRWCLRDIPNEQPPGHTIQETKLEESCLQLSVLWGRYPAPPPIRAAVLSPQQLPAAPRAGDLTPGPVPAWGLVT